MTDEPPMIIMPGAQKQAQMFLLRAYGREEDAIRDIVGQVRLPDELRIEEFPDIEAFMEAVERIADVVSLEELQRKRDLLPPQVFGGFLYTLRTRGRMPHWIAPFLDCRTLEPGFEEAWDKRVGPKN